MGMRLEYLAATMTGVDLLVESDLPAAEDPRHKPVLVLSGDEGVVIEGSRRELRALIARMTEAVDTWDDVALAADIAAQSDLGLDEEASDD